MKHDTIGPEVVLHLYDPHTGMRGIIVLDSMRRGPAKGGIRMALSADEDEVLGLARAMTLKNSLADLPFGGGKSGILADPKTITAEQKEALVRAFARKLALVAPDYYIAAPDIAMGEQEMRWIAAEAGPRSITGKPADLGGIPHELGSTGYGVFIAVRELLAMRNDSLKGKHVSIEGYGNVGSFAATFMAENGAVLVAASDSSGAIVDPKGINAEELRQWKEAGKRIIDYPKHDKQPADAVLFVPCDILVPAAHKHVITEANYKQVRAKIIAQGANLPIPEHVETLLEAQGVTIIPDILANAGGVISSWVEHEGGSAADIFDHIERIISKNIHELRETYTKGGSARDAALAIAMRRLEKKKKE
jgi:glutamate dehydrogenase (NAD(P)+)